MACEKIASDKVVFNFRLSSAFDINYGRCQFKERSVIKFLMPRLVLQGVGVHILFSCISPKKLIIGLKLCAPPCQVLAGGLLLVLPPNVLLRIVLLNLILAALFYVFWLEVALVWFAVTYYPQEK